VSTEFNQELLQSLANKLAVNLKTENDLSALCRELVKLSVESAPGKKRKNISVINCIKPPAMLV